MMTEITPKGVLRNAVLLGLIILALWVFTPLNDYFERHGVTIESTIANTLIGILGLLAALSLWFVIEAFFLTPARLDLEARSSVAVLNSSIERLTPRIEISLEKDGELSHLSAGGTNEDFGGRLYTHYTHFGSFACLLCKNVSEAVVTNCQVRLTHVWNLTGSEAVEVHVLESIPHGWSRYNDPLQLKLDILPRETKRIYVAQVRRNGRIALCMPFERQPIEYHSMFEAPGHYRLGLAISHDDGPTRVVHLDVESGEPPPDKKNLRDSYATLRLLQVVTVS